MTSAEMRAELGSDAAKWALEFCRIERERGHDLDEGWVIAWFALFADVIEAASEAAAAAREDEVWV